MFSVFSTTESSFRTLLSLVVAVPILLFPALAGGSLLHAQGQSEPPAPPVAEPEVSLLETGVEVSGVTPGGEVALLSVWREQGAGGSQVTVTEETLVDEDGDGTVTLDVGRPLPALAVWVVVDVASGERRVVTPESFEAERREVRPGAFRAAGELVELAVPRAEVLVVRPGRGENAGAFRARLGDGGEGDRDGEINGRVALSALEIERPVARPPDLPEPPRPARFQGRDRVIAIDPRTLVVTEVAVPAETEGGQP